MYTEYNILYLLFLIFILYFLFFMFQEIDVELDVA